ncbi:hypothetical protein ESA94_09395 [Lacibacter luteus]|uniref:Uncharacterized protein n=1 Tax=Lacibacter luteus TaxID=2508719 RepID=A0A4Q1CJV7_9BACT|nr:hypothetical protein [Lacibacter luteus]RXK60668.1 hypothetical protein ESA94_09395 [Lacibacter luteus]
MKKYVLGFSAVVLAAVMVAFTQPVTRNYDSDLVWFAVDANGNATNPTNGTMGDEPPISCPGSLTPCARALSISQGEVSLNSGSSTVYHINTGYSTVSDYDEERKKD